MQFPARLGLPLVVAALSLPGCGGKSTTRDGDGNANSDSGSANGDAGSANSSGGATSNSGSANSDAGSANSNSGGSTTSGGAASGGSPAQCDDYANETGWLVAVRLSNGTKRPLYFGSRMPGCGLGSLFQVADASGMTLEAPGFCSSTCQDLAHGSTISCPPILCPAGAVIRVLPGEAVIQHWSGAFLVQETLRPGCHILGENSNCTRVAAVKPGTFTFTGGAATEIDCSPFGGMCPACMPDSNGGCATYGAVIAGPELTATATVMLDASYGVGLTGNKPRPVEIVFTE
jgi:hypothetical protein